MLQTLLAGYEKEILIDWNFGQINLSMNSLDNIKLFIFLFRVSFVINFWLSLCLPG